MPAELIAQPDGQYIADCSDCPWTGTPRRRAQDAHGDANTHNLTNHLPAWIYAPETSGKQRGEDNP